ncbi:MAG: hypothetical protein FJZ62_06190 [Chlamydiae bacterium]|nr:hypothetical protein [Chlamydiota bacterium]
MHSVVDLTDQMTLVIDSLNRCEQHLVRQSQYRILKENPHYQLLESVRSDLVHLNSEKKERLIYSIEKYLRDPDLDRNDELSGVLKKVIKLVEKYVPHCTLLFKPKGSRSFIDPEKPFSSPARRKLFPDE